MQLLSLSIFPQINSISFSDSSLFILLISLLFSEFITSFQYFLNVSYEIHLKSLLIFSLSINKNIPLVL